ncbi:MAG: hypothetical protein ACN4G0_04895 [Polyangiales bacterium]
MGEHRVAMAELQGIFFKNVIGGMLFATSLFPEFSRRVQEMNDESWYDWDEFCYMSNRIGERLSPKVLHTLGRKVVHGAKDHFAAQGLNSTENILRQLDTLFMANIRNAPDWQHFRTESYAPGCAVCVSTVPQPLHLIEGYLAGYVTMYGHKVTSLSSERIERRPVTNRISITWEERG